MSESLYVASCLRPRRSAWRRGPALHRLVVCALLTASLACATRSEQKADVETGEYTSSVTIVGGKAEAILIQARHAIAEGDFDAGIEAFKRVYSDPQVESKFREQALFGLGQSHSNVLNPKRDTAQAKAAYRKFLEEFPASKLRVDVEEALRSLEASEGK